MAAQLAQQFQAIDAGQVAIGNHQAGQAALALGQRRFAVGDLQDARIRAHIAHQLHQQVSSPGFGFGDQDFRSDGRGSHANLRKGDGKVIASGVMARAV